MNISELKVEEPYKSLFLIDEDVLAAIEEDMEVNGYDQSKPIIIWAGRNVVIDGHTRLKAAQNIGRKKVAVHELDFETPTAALKYALHHQRNRRHLDDAHILYLVKRFDNFYQRGGDRRSIFANAKVDSANSDSNIDRKYRSSRDVTAELIGISADRVSKCRHILKNCTDKEIQAIRDRKISVHRAWKSSFAAEKSEEKKAKKQELDRKKLEEFRVQDFHSDWGMIGDRYHAQLVEKIDRLVLKLLPNLDKRKADMYEIRKIVEAFEFRDETFEIFCNRLSVQRFLGSLFIQDFLAILKFFGYEFTTSRDLKVIKEERIMPVKKKRPAPRFSISRVQEYNFLSKAQRREHGRHWAEVVQRDIEEGTLKVD